MRCPLVALALFALTACSTAPPSVAGTHDDAQDHAAILTTVDRFFEAMAARDPQACAATTTGDGMVHSVTIREGRAALRARSMRDFAEQLKTGTERLVETYWQPTILQRGPVAMVWTPYRFRVDGVDSHGGVDVFTLVKDRGEWRIANAAYTAEPAGDAVLTPDLAPAPGAIVRPASLR